MRFFLFLVFTLCCALAALAGPAEVGLATLREHPRLVLTEARVGEMQALATTDPVYAAAQAALLERAKLYAAMPPIQDSTDWNTWREAVARVYILGVSWRLTGEAVYADKAREVLLTACAFPNWHDDKSFLDTAEMTHAVATGYDWLYPRLSAEDRATVRTALLEKGLQPGLAAYAGTAKGSWWTTCNHNWNLVCNAGMISGALAIAESDPETARAVLTQAVASMRHALPSYDPDGAWMEGPYYWEYATRYCVLALASLESALGTDCGLAADTPGLRTTWRYATYFTAPNVPAVFAYGDSLDHRWNLPFVFWLARRFNDDAAAAAERRYFGTPHPWWRDINAEVKDPRFAVNRALDLIWYVPARTGAEIKALPLDTVFKGKVELAAFRSAWDDPKALCVFVKAGPNGGLANHGHLDAGQFEIYALGNGGIRWARDTKKGGYPAGFFDNGTPEKPGQRWTYQITNSLGHNVPVLNGANQRPFAVAPITRFASSPAFSFVTIDLTPVYQAKAAARGVALLERRAVLVQDEFTLDAPTDLAWGMNTDAQVTLDGATATLTMWGQQLTATLLAPAGATFDPATLKDHRLTIHLPNQQGTVRLAVLFAPKWPDGKTVAVPAVKALAEWGVEKSDK